MKTVNFKQRNMFPLGKQMKSIALPRVAVQSLFSVNLYVNNNQCRICGKVYAQCNSLYRHYKEQHTSIKIICCPICGKGWNRKDNYKRHLLQKHGVNDRGLSVIP